MPKELKAGMYTGKGHTIVMAEDGRNLYAFYEIKNFGVRKQWPAKYKTHEEFAKANGMVRTGDFKGVFF